MSVGKITIISGPMFSGKTEELIRLVRRSVYAGKKCIVFKPKIDNRYDKEKVCSHNGSILECIIVDKAMGIIDYLEKHAGIDVVGIDEIQFFDDQIEYVVREIARRGYGVIGAGLDKDFRGEPFGRMANLLCVAEETPKLAAVCHKCGEDAYFTQRIVNGKPASYNDEIVKVGAAESYEARCREHHEVPDHLGFQKE